LDKLLDALPARSLPIKDAIRISQIALLDFQRKQSTAEFSAAAPQAIGTIADDEEDSYDEE
jgi:hypothetical protein